MKNIHFVHGLGDDGFHICDRLAIASAAINNPDWTVHLWCPEEPKGEHWEKLIQKVRVKVMLIDNPLVWNDRVVGHYANRTDLIRLSVLYAMGGVYCDTDTLTIAPFPEKWFDHQAVIGHEFCESGTIGLCNAIIFAKPFSRFIWKWLQKAQDYDGYSWNTLAVEWPHQIWKEDNTICHPVDFEMLGFIHCGSGRYWDGIHSLEGCVTAHLWRTYHKKKMNSLTDEEILKREFTYSHYAYKYL